MQRALLFTLSLLMASSAFAGPIFDSLDESEKAQLEEGQQVSKFRDIEGEVWPEGTIYQIAQATPEQAFAVFSDYGTQKDYLPRVAESTAVPTNDPLVTEVQYTLNIPYAMTWVFDPNYSVKDTLSYLGSSEGFKVEWTLLNSASLAKVEGSAVFEPLSSGKTLIVYQNFLAPVPMSYGFGSFVSFGPIVDQVAKGGADVLRAIVERVESEQKNHPRQIQSRIATLRKNLGLTEGS